MKRLRPEILAAMHADIRRRIEIQHLMAEHAKPVLELEYGLDPTTIWHIETGQLQTRGHSRIPPTVVNNVIRRRKIWRLAKEQMQDYLLNVLEARYDVTKVTLIRHAWIVREQMRNEQQEMTARTA